MPTVLTTPGPANEIFDVQTEGGPVVRVESVAMAGTLLAFVVNDNDGTVGANAVVSHNVAVAGIVAATDKVIGVDVPVAASGSGLVVTASVASDGHIQLNYKNVKTGGETNGAQDYTVFISRSP